MTTCQRSSSVLAARGRVALLPAIVVLLAALASLAALVLLSPAPATGAATLPSGFQDSTVFGGLSAPMSVEFSKDGRVFVTEKSGIIKVFDNLSDTTPTTFADLRTNVYNRNDRGLLGLALDPNFPAQPYVYVSYAYDAPIGGDAPYWGQPGADFDDCPTPPGPTDDGCVISGRISRLTVDANGTMGQEKVLVEDWCQQYPSHSMGDLAFGSDGALYASGGDGASFNFADYGQDGDPLNPCGDPPSQVGGVQTPPTAEGGSLRSQDLRTPDDPTGLNGAIVRLDPQTGEAQPDNPLAASSDANARRIVAYGLRNPFRFTIKPGTNQVWIGNVGGSSQDEIEALTDPKGSPVENFGWPCYNGTKRFAPFDSADLDMCENLYAQPSATTGPYYAHNRNQPVVQGETCPNDQDALSGLAFYNGGNYPPAYDGALFFTDYTRSCIWAMFKGANGLPDPSNIATLVDGGLDGSVTAVDLEIGPGGDLFYVNIGGRRADDGEVHRIHYLGANQPPRAVVQANPTQGAAPLEVSFDASGSSDPEGDSLAYAWDLDDDGAYDDATTAQATWTYTAEGSHTARLRVTDSQNATDTTAVDITVGGPPTATIDTPLPTTTWRVGDEISFSGSASDPQEGQLPASALSWSLVVHHCPVPESCHQHPIQDYSGVASGSFVTPDHEYPSYLELKLTATDATGLSDTRTLRLDPQAVQMHFESTPTGLLLVVGDSEPAATPFNRTVIVGSKNSISAPSPQTLQGADYRFGSWSDGGAQSHDVIATATPSTYTATFEASSPPTNCTITGTSKGETLVGTSGPDHFCAGSGSDTIKGLGGNDILKGEKGDDKLYGGEGNDVLDGGAHVNGDTANFSESLGAVSVSLTNNTATGEGSDTLVGVEKIIGSPGNDTLIGSVGNDNMSGGAGADTMNGMDGADTLIGQGGGDTVRGGAGNDSVIGSPGADNLFGDDGDDTVDSKDGTSGNDSLDGGAHVNGDTAVTDASEKSVIGFP
jgi:glucose/arabinose dehydrogenase